MALVRDQALCLRRLDYSETSQILAIYTRHHGLLRVIAKGAKRTTKAGASKFDGGLDLLDLGDAVLIHQPEKDMSTLTEWTLLEGHLALRESLRSLYLGQYAAELITLLFEEHDPHPEVFDDLVALVPQLSTDRAEEAFLAYELRLFYSAGLLPELTRCTSCGRVVDDAPPGFFSPSRGGVVCRDCEAAGIAPDRLSIDPRILRIARSLAGVVLPRTYTTPPPPLAGLRLPRLTRLQTDPLNRLLIGHLQFVTHRSPRLGPYVVEAPIGRPAVALRPKPVSTAAQPRIRASEALNSAPPDAPHVDSPSATLSAPPSVLASVPVALPAGAGDDPPRRDDVQHPLQHEPRPDVT